MPLGTTASGGGGGTSDIRAGGAYVEIYGKSKLKEDLEKAKSNAKAWSASMSQIGKAAGFLGITAGVTEIAKIGLDMAAGVEKFNAAMEEGGRITEQVADAQRKLRESVFEKLGGKVSRPVELVPEERRREFLAQQINQAEKNLEGYARDADKANEAVTALAGGWNLVQQRIPIWNDALETQRAQAKAQADELNRQRKEVQAHLAALRDQSAAMKNPQEVRQGDFMKSAAELEKSLRFQLETIGMTADEAALYKLQVDAVAKGLKNVELNLENSRQLMKDIAASKLFDSLKAEGKAFAQELEDSLRFAGMTADEIRLKRLQEARGGPGVDRNLPGLLAMRRDLERMEELRNAPPPGMNVKGTFSGPMLQQFGAGDTFQRQMAQDTKKIAANGQAAVAELQLLNNNVRGLQMNFK